MRYTKSHLIYLKINILKKIFVTALLDIPEMPRQVRLLTILFN